MGYELMHSRRSPIAFKIKLTRYFLPYIIPIAAPSLLRKLIDWIPFGNLQEAKRIVDILDSSSKNILEKKRDIMLKQDYDEKVTQEVGKGKDLTSVLRKHSVHARMTSSTNRSLKLNYKTVNTSFESSVRQLLTSTKGREQGVPDPILYRTQLRSRQRHRPSVRY